MALGQKTSYDERSMVKKSNKIYFFEVEPWEKQYISTLTKGLRVVLVSGKLTPRTAAKYKDARIISTFIYSAVSKEALVQMQGLRMIATRSTGFDHIDLEFCRKKKITVANVPTYGENTVAEHTFALMLTLSRKIVKAYAKVRALDFDFHGLRGWDLKDKTLGIIGCGHIGEHVARIARGFDMKVIVYDLHRNPALARKLGFSYAPTLAALLKCADVVTLHAPYNKATHHIINRETLRLMKRTAILINTARGGLVDTNALVWALKKNIIAGAGIDVLEEERAIKEEREIVSPQYAKKNSAIATLLANHVLIMRDDTVVTPHIAFNSAEAIERILVTTVQNIRAFLKGKKANTVA